MQRTFLLLILPVLFSCKEISYKEPQPRGKKPLTEIPKKLQGKYLFANDEGTSHDTLVVTRKGYYSNKSPKEEAVLSDTLVLKKFNGYYFLNINDHPEWLLRVIKPEKNGDLIFMTMERSDRDFSKLLRALSVEISIDSVETNGEKLYQINPSPKQLVSLIRKGFFKQSVIKRLR